MLTQEVLANCPQFLNTLKEYELDLRGLNLVQIENLGITKDNFQTIDFTDNGIIELENFPLMNNLEIILMANNKVHSIDPDIGVKLRNLRSINLQNNQIATVDALKPLASLKKLKYLNLKQNPVTKTPDYRKKVLAILPFLQYLDDYKISQAEREGKISVQMPSDIPAKLTDEETNYLLEKLQEATTIEEIQILERALKEQKMPPNF